MANRTSCPSCDSKRFKYNGLTHNGKQNHKDSVKNKLSFWRPDLRQIRASRFQKTAGVVVLH